MRHRRPYGAQFGAISSVVPPVGWTCGAVVAAGTTGGAGNLPARRQRLQYFDAATGHLDITAASEFPEDAIDHVA